jgi:hypothetical protein
MSKRLKADAYQAIEDIENGRKPRVNRDANTNFMQTIIDYAKAHDMDEGTFDAIYEYAMSHLEIVARNTAREAKAAVDKFLVESSDTLTQNMLGAPVAPPGGNPLNPNPSSGPIPIPTAPIEKPLTDNPSSVSIGLKASQALKNR